MIREASLDDLEDLVEIGHLFVAEAGETGVDNASLRFSLAELIEHGVLLVHENGFIDGVAGALMFPNYWNHHTKIAQELFWYVMPHARGSTIGVRLLKALESAVQIRGASKLIMLCLADVDGEKVSDMYRRMHYQPKERTFEKVF